MSAVQSELLPEQFVTMDDRPIVVVGSGPVGVSFCQEIARQSPHKKVVLYGEEPWDPYNRVKLSLLLAGDVDEEAISNRVSLEEIENLETRYNTRVTEIDSELKLIRDEKGGEQFYSALVIATGANARAPGIEGETKDGIYSFRNMRDVHQLKARQFRSRHVVILGGGLLGLETARAMRTFNTEVTVIDHNSHLMFRQLDEESGELLREHVMGEGINVWLRDSVKTINGESRLESISLRSGREIDCDTLILATGISPNTSLAKKAGLSVGQGIRVDEHMRTSAPSIYAIGECIEFNQQTYGTVAPGYEQAAVAASSLSGMDASYVDSMAASRLKVLDCSVYSLGDIKVSLRDFSNYQFTDEQIYRRLNISRGKIIGVVAFGAWDELGRIQEMVTSERMIWPWQLARFKKTGMLWAENEQSVKSWPAQAVVCNCTGVSCGQLRTEIKAGCETLEQLASRTGASTVCGTCKPLLVELVGEQVNQPPERGFKPLIVGSILCFLIALITTLSPRVALPDSVQIANNWHLLWTDSLLKQISGFSLLFLSIVAAVLSLRKRVKKVSFGEFTGWRVVHVMVGLLILIGLFIHTGFRLGDNLNFWLMSCFMGMLMSGAVVGSVIAMQHKLRASQVKKIRSQLFWVHILLFWPVPALLTFHALKSYYY